ncbi:hypothetical protein ACFWBM_40550 [Streptomyces sp. NPDC059980]
MVHLPLLCVRDQRQPDAQQWRALSIATSTYPPLVDLVSRMS